MLRVIQADQEDFEQIASLSGSSLNRSIRDAQVAVSLKNELKAMDMLATICDTYLKRYPTSFEDDCERLLNDSSLKPFSNERHALVQIKGEKEVLLFFQDWALTAIQLIQIRDTDHFDRKLEEIKKSKHFAIYQYCRVTLSRLHHDGIRRNEYQRGALDLSKPTIV